MTAGLMKAIYSLLQKSGHIHKKLRKLSAAEGTRLNCRLQDGKSASEFPFLSVRQFDAAGKMPAKKRAGATAAPFIPYDRKSVRKIEKTTASKNERYGNANDAKHGLHLDFLNRSDLSCVVPLLSFSAAAIWLTSPSVILANWAKNFVAAVSTATMSDEINSALAVTTSDSERPRGPFDLTMRNASTILSAGGLGSVEITPFRDSPFILPLLL